MHQDGDCNLHAYSSGMRLTGDDLPATELAQLRQTFEAFVDSQNGLADTIALKKALLATAFVQDNGSELYPVILELDRKNGSKITFQEFIEIFAADSNLLQFQLPLNPQTAQRVSHTVCVSACICFCVGMFLRGCV